MRNLHAAIGTDTVFAGIEALQCVVYANQGLFRFIVQRVQYIVIFPLCCLLGEILLHRFLRVMNIRVECVKAFSRLFTQRQQPVFDFFVRVHGLSVLGIESRWVQRTVSVTAMLLHYIVVHLDELAVHSDQGAVHAADYRAHNLVDELRVLIEQGFKRLAP